MISNARKPTGSTDSTLPIGGCGFCRGLGLGFRSGLDNFGCAFYNRICFCFLFGSFCYFGSGCILNHGCDRLGNCLGCRSLNCRRSRFYNFLCCGLFYGRLSYRGSSLGKSLMSCAAFL